VLKVDMELGLFGWPQRLSRAYVDTASVHD
jgi:hypothetical protein